LIVGLSRPLFKGPTMTCLKCQHGTAVKAGTTSASTQRFRCNDCGARFTQPRQNALGSHTTAVDDAVKVFTLLAEGMSIRTIRMQMRRFTRLTNGFSKKLDNLKAAVAVFMAWYNFCRVHQTLRVTPAMEAGLTDHVWSVRELLTADEIVEQQAA